MGRTAHMTILRIKASIPEKGIREQISHVRYPPRSVIAVFNRYFTKNGLELVLKPCLYNIYGSTQEQVVSILSIVPIKTPATPKYFARIMEAIRLIRDSKTGLYLS